MEIRYNAMKASGIQSFVNIHSNTRNSVKQVCFARCIGYNDSLSADLNSADAFLSNSPNYTYMRITGFAPQNTSEINTYISKYKQLRSPEPMLLSSITDKLLNRELAQACNCICNIIKAAYPQHNETISKNLAVSLIFWADKYLPDFLTYRDDRFCKLICSGKIGYREYAFCCLAAMMGVDVLILLPEGDLDLPTALLNKSTAFTIGNTGKYPIPDFHKCTASKESLFTQNTLKHTPEIKNKQRPLNDRANRTAESNISDVRRELTYEEIAGYAESVVMITVYDSNNNIISGGSGIAISSGGYILTNCHVISGGSYYSVRFENDNNKYVTPYVIKYHQQMDLALIRIDRALKPLKIYSGSSELQRGQRVIAIGSPLGLFNSVSDGIISGFRNINEKDMIQFTAPISNGSSGGALLNMYGELIGICTAGIDGGQNINLAVAYKQIQQFVKNFL